jgi:stage V sporulation protein AB
MVPEGGKNWMWIRLVAMALIGLSAGVVVAGGLFGFIVGLGVISDFADRTRTASKVRLYEDMIAAGGILGNLIYTYQISLHFLEPLLGVFGLFSGIFVGCWAMALTEVLNVFPIFARRVRLKKGIAYVILGFAIGKGIGSFAYFFYKW